MQTYAYIVDGIVRQIIVPLVDAEGGEVPVSARFTPEFVADLIDISSLVPLPKEGEAYINGTFSPVTPAPLTWASYQISARSALDQSDVTILRCAENSIGVPPEWASYRKALRAIVSSSTGDPSQPLPTRPAFPSGT